MQIPISGPGEAIQVTAERSRQEMARLMAVAGHDLKQPIQVAMLSLAMAIRGDVSAPTAKRLKVALDAMKRLNVELDDIARLSQRDGVTSVRLRPVHLGELLAEVEADWRIYTDACGTVLTIDSHTGYVATDPRMLKTILRNLVGNAIRHAGARGHVSVHCQRYGDRIRINVEDNGDGIPAAYLSRIFDAFERGSASGRDDGLGLGLTIVRQTADLLRHPISVRSAENEGSTFSIEVPCAGVETPPVIDADFVRSGRTDRILRP